MNPIKTITGVTEVYDSSQTKGFEQAERYPIAWELIYINDAAGQKFTGQLLQTLRELPQEKGYRLMPDDEPLEKMNCVECVFDSIDSFRKVVNQAFNGFALYDYQQEKITPKQMLVDTAGKIMEQKVAVAV